MDDVVYLKVCFLSAPLKFCFLLCRFVKGLPVKCASLSEDLEQAIGLEPMPKGISYIISTQVYVCTNIDLCPHFLFNMHLRNIVLHYFS